MSRPRRPTAMNGSRLLLAMIVAAAAVVVLPATAHACSCVERSDRQNFDDADAVFAGTVAHIDDPQKGSPVISSGGPVYVTLEVDAVMKGEVGPTAEVTTALMSASCGYEFRAETRYLVYAYESEDGEGRLSTNSCSNNRPLSDGEPLPFAAESPGAPESPPPEGGGTGGFDGTATGIAVAVVVGILLRWYLKG